MTRDEDFQPRPGRSRSPKSVRAKPFVTQVLIAAAKAGGRSEWGERAGTGGGNFGRGRAAVLRAGRGAGSRHRSAVVKARVVRHGPSRTPLHAHMDYLRRDGATRDGERGRLFDASSDEADGREFAERCRDDRHHFRFIVSPDDAEELQSLRAFTRDLMAQAEKDLGTRLDWVAVDHWNTEHPHIHVLVRGVASDGSNLVISRDYIREGLRLRAGERVNLELGPRSELEIYRAQAREVDADRWTRLDRALSRDAEMGGGVVDLRPPAIGQRDREGDPLRTSKLARMRKLEQLGFAEPLGPAQWRLSPDAETTLRELGERGDIIKRMHRAMADRGQDRGASDMVLNGEPQPDRSVIGRLAARGLDDELRGSAYVVIDGVDGRAHHIRFATLEAAGDSEVGSIVEARWTESVNGRRARLVLAVRCDLDIQAQVNAKGATWLDRQLVSRTPVGLADRGFGQEVQGALDQRRDYLIERGLAERRSNGTAFAPGLLATLRRQELDQTAKRIAEQSGLTHHPVAQGDAIEGEVRRRITLASGRFAMIDDGLGFQLVPWRDDLGRELGRQVSGIAIPGGGVEWSFGRKRDLGL